MIFSDFVRHSQELLNSKTSFVIVTMVDVDAHVPQEIGAKMIVTQEGLHSGTVGGGKLEAKCIDTARQLMSPTAKTHQKAAHLLRIDLNQDLGMVCGGVATVLFEVMSNQVWTIALYGMGHVGQALAAALANLNCDVICVDSRQEWIDKLPHRERQRKVLTDDMSKVPASLPTDTYHVIATQGHIFDLAVAREVLTRANVPYIGVIGSKVKARKIRAMLMSEGFSEQDVQRFFCPMGLPIGNNTPAEIAISIIAQMLQVRG